ncbi:Hypothetical predicted protein [Lecanosticta acicola]|uniref:Uncharacterized protein n=1 Tax=Lecanosticta acicola TaxID=111012 RepID=A0AAI9EDV6_9PEZI|nr:Hypothetical predicted protein [Lecanosticta acicola]
MPASPTLSVPTTPTAAPRQPVIRKVKRESSWSPPRPLATSRAPLTTARHKEAKNDQVGFLHLPDDVRMRIFKLAIFDHDRGAVFLPRNHPRKVVPGLDDVDLVCVNPTCLHGHEEVGFDMDYRLCHLVSTSEEGTASAGEWIGPETPGVEEPLELGVPYQDLLEMTDGEVLQLIEPFEDEQGEAGESAVTATLNGASDGSSDESHEDLDESLCQCIWCYRERANHNDSLSASDDDVAEGSENRCTDLDSTNFFQGLSDEELSEGDSSNSPGCNLNPCDDLDCRRCVDHPDRFEDYTKTDSDQSNVLKFQELHQPDDLEHADTEEVTGMLYEPQEPAILKASREIRAQALPTYYSTNAFSWRFLWTDYEGSCFRFKAWALSIPPSGIEAMTKVTFQGRHAVEEGVEFSIDIDLTDDHPFFETNVYCDETDEAVGSICEAINRDTARLLWFGSRTHRSRTILAADILCELANIFVQGMHW